MQPKARVEMVRDNMDDLVDAGYGKKEAEKIVMGKDIKKKVIKNKSYEKDIINLAINKHEKR
jgi:hypothetical protein